jgi:xanthine dehydrogenase YagR molybdenum-binding subunit
MLSAPAGRPDGRAKVTGAATYAAEKSPRNVLHAVMVTAPVAHGRVARIQADAAQQHPGVVAVLTRADMPKLGTAPVPPAAQSFVPMQSDEIQYEGQPVALVLAETLEAAEQGAALMQIEYTRQPPAVPEGSRSLEPRTSGNGYAFAEIDTNKGDEGSAFARAAVKIEAEYVTATRHHNMMEPSATLAEWRGDELYVHDATQWTYGIRYALSAWLGMPAEKIHVRCPYTGGGFGAKGYVWPHQVLAPLAARLVGRPVKLAIERVGCYTGTGYQPSVRSRVRLGADREGRLESVAHETVNESSQFDDYIEFGSAGTRGLYATPALATRTRIVKAHVGTPTALRAPHEGPGMFALGDGRARQCARPRSARAADAQPRGDRPAQRPTVLVQETARRLRGRSETVRLGAAPNGAAIDAPGRHADRLGHGVRHHGDVPLRLQRPPAPTRERGGDHRGRLPGDRHGAVCDHAADRG